MENKSAVIRKIIFFSCIFIAALTVSIVFISMKKSDSRFVFLFESLDDPYEHVEVRYMNTVPGEDAVTCFTKELLLGPSTNRYRPLFAKGTTVESCFIRDGILYLDLSAEALLKEGISSETEHACNLLKKNISTNFRQVLDTKVFICGIEAYTKEEAFIVNVE